MDYDILIVGAGIAGMESALTMGDMGYRVLLVEKEASVGGKMILLSKVFPTLDCASCISTPKMAATAHHPNVRLLTYSEVDEITRQEDGTFRVCLHKKSPYVDPEKCTGCYECEIACTVAISDEFNADLVAHRAAHIPFPQAVPKKAVIKRSGTSPCTFHCPGGVKAHGYISLVRAGKYEEAFNLHMEDAPLPGSLSRACYAPCEEECTRGELEGTLPIRMIKRYMVDRYYGDHPEPEYGPLEKVSKSPVAIIGSGPAGLSAAYFLARKGYSVTIFERAKEPGGMLRYGIPPYRLPRNVLDRDIKNVTALGVEIKTEFFIDSLSDLQSEGYDAIFLAGGTMEGSNLRVEGEELEGVIGCMEFLKAAFTSDAPHLEGARVVVIGGGNVAIDSARTALRLGAREVVIQYRRSRLEMPAHDWEVEAALTEGVKLEVLKSPGRFIGSEGRLVGMDTISMKLGDPDESGRRRPLRVKGSGKREAVDLVIVAIGLKPSTTPFSGELELNPSGTVRVDEETLETSFPSVFAGGDMVTGPSMIINAIGQGKRAAISIDRYLKGERLDEELFHAPLPPVDKKRVLFESRGNNGRGNGDGKRTVREALTHSEIPLLGRALDMREVELPFTEEEIRYSANRCLDCGICSECHECVHACPADAIDFSMREEERKVDVGSVILSTGFELFDAHLKPVYGFGKFPNVITSMQMDRLLAPTRPYNHVIRPSDGKAPDNIAYVLCTGSRDHTVNNPLCSRVCCMYSIKQAELILGALPLADVTIYYMDIRAFGKGYDEFYRQARDMGVYFVKGKVAKIEEGEGGNLVLFYEDIEGGEGTKQSEHDLVVLSVGLLPGTGPEKLFGNSRLEVDPYAYVMEVDEDINPGKTSIDGVFVAGTASGARDIPDTILHSGAAAAQAAAYLEKVRAKR